MPLLIIFTAIAIAIINVVCYLFTRPGDKEVNQLEKRIWLLEEQARRRQSVNGSGWLCANCGTPLKDDAVFCVACGKRV